MAKIFYKQKITDQDKKYVREFLKIYDIRVHFVKQGWSFVVCCENLITLDLREADTIQTLWSCVFHELSHIICYRTNVYRIFHHDALPEKQLAKYVRRNGLRIEKFIDKKAKKLMGDYFPDIPFIGCYALEENQLWFKRWIKRNYPL